MYLARTVGSLNGIGFLDHVKDFIFDTDGEKRNQHAKDYYLCHDQ
jgi:hypothetical protein